MKTVKKLDYIYKNLLYQAKQRRNETIEITDSEYDRLYHDTIIEPIIDPVNPDEPIVDPAEENEHDYSKDYLTFEALEDGILITTFDIEYSINNGDNWIKLTNNPGYSSLISKNTQILIKSSNKPTSAGTSHANIEFSNKFNIFGNIMSLIWGDEFKEKNELKKIYSTYPLDSSFKYDAFIFSYLFCNSKVISAKNLILPLLTLENTENCYNGMFYNCKLLIESPKLPATTLADYCYREMFSGCTSLIIAPKLPATILESGCYGGMFKNCTSLTTAPKLPATILESGCYSGMFEGCTSLTTAPVLPATILENSCYGGMFKNCTSLTTAPKLPATILESCCYSGMFKNCTSLTTAPELSAITLADYCYQDMFYGCISLTYAPALPATTLAAYCYSWMFDGCISLTKAPKLPANILVNGCYCGMFSNCESLNYIKCLYNIMIGNNNIDNWVYNVSITGTFIKLQGVEFPIGSSGIPQGWTVQELDPDTGEIVNEYIAE